MKNPPLTFALLSLPLLFVPGLATSQEPVDAEGGVVTLYARDDLLSSFDFRNAAAGGQVLDGQIDLSRAQLIYGVFAEELFSYGFVHDEIVQLVDVGAEYVEGLERATDPAAKFPISVFHTLCLEGPNFAYQNTSGRFVRLKSADRVLGPAKARGIGHLPVEIGHVYVLRASTRAGGRVGRLFKFQVIDHRPGQSVTLRWAPLREL